MPTQLSGFRCRLSFAGCVLFLTLSHAAAEDVKAEPRLPDKADELFARGKQRLNAADYQAACPLLAESYRLDPATGSLLALALCHERQGKLASALSEYGEAVERSRNEKRLDREQAARARVLALQGRASTVAISTMQRSEELVVRLNDATLTPDQLGRPLPIDGGFLLVEAEAAGRLPWRHHLKVADSGEAVTLTVPALEPVQKATVAARPAPVAAPVLPRLRQTPRGPRFSTAEKTGIALMAVGALGATVSLGYTVRALTKGNDPRADCDEDECTAAGRAVKEQARRAGDIATISVLAAVVAGGTGLITLLVGRENKGKRGDVRASGWLAPGGGAGATLAGRF